MRRAVITLLGLLALAPAARNAWGWTIGTAATKPCHEKLTLQGARDYIDGNRIFGTLSQLPNDTTWKGLYRTFDQRLGLGFDDEHSRFEVTSLLVGVRYPDIGDSSVANANGLQQCHENPLATSSHFMRAPNQDYSKGDLAAYFDGDAHLRREIGLAWNRAKDIDPLEPVRVYLDEYGSTELTLWGPAFHLGIALHIFEDSFSHCLRSNDLHRIRHVMNAVEAGNYEFDPERDGLPHSSGMDACDGPGAPIADAVPEAVADLLAAVSRIDDEDGLNTVLERWLSYEPGCDIDNDFCDSAWLDIAHSETMTAPFDCGTLTSVPARLSLVSLLRLLFE